MLKVRPKLHLVTYYRLLPLLAIAIVLGIASYFGVSEKTFYGVFIWLVVSTIMLSLMALFEPMFSEITVENDSISYLTSVGGEVVVDLNNLNLEKSVWDESGLTVVDAQANEVFISSLIFSRADIEKVYEVVTHKS